MNMVSKIRVAVYDKYANMRYLLHGRWIKAENYARLPRNSSRKTKRVITA